MITIPAHVAAAFVAASNAAPCPRCGSTRRCRCAIPAADKDFRVIAGLKAAFTAAGVPVVTSSHVHPCDRTACAPFPGVF